MVQKKKVIKDLNNNGVEDRYSKQWVITSILIDILTNEENLNKEYFSRKYFISKSLLNKYINDLKDLCFENNLEFKINSKHSLYIHGDELDKVNFLYKLLKKKIKKSNIEKKDDSIIDKFNKVNELLRIWIEDSVDEFVSNKQLDDITYFTVSLLLISDVSDVNDYINKDIYDYILNLGLNLDDFTIKLEKELKNHINETKKKYIAIKIYEKLIIYNRFSIEELNLNAKLIFDDYIKNLKTLFNFDLNVDKGVYDAFINHLCQTIYRVKNKLSIYNPLNDEIKEHYKKYLYITKIINFSFKNVLNIDISDDEITYLSLYMYIFLEDKSIKLKVGVICQYGVGVSKALTFRLENEYPNIKFYSIGINDYNKYDYFDIYLSTIDVDSNKDVILISPFLDNKDKIKIDNYLNKLENNFSLIQKHHIEIIDYKTSREDILMLSCIKLYDLGYVSECYYDSVINREKIGSTEIGNGVVLTHGMPKFVNESVIYFNMLKKSVLWKSQEVNLVVILSLTEEDSKRSIDLNWLWKFLNSEKLKEIKNINRKEEFVELLLSR